MNFLFGNKNKGDESKDGHIFYHYTSRSNAESISCEGVIRKVGNGVLLTTMAPERYYRNEILLNNYGENTPAYLQNRADFCVRVLSSKLIGQKLKKQEFPPGRLVYLYDGDIRVNELDVFDKPECKRIHQETTPSATGQQSSSISSSTLAQKRIHSTSNVNDHHDAAVGKAKKMSEIKINLRDDIKFWQPSDHQDEDVTISSFKWINEGLKYLRKSFDDEILVNCGDPQKRYIISGDFSLKELQILSRNEPSNTNGVINFGNYDGISKEVVYSLKDLNRQTVIIGKDFTTHYGGYPHENIRMPQREAVYVCDLVGLQFQQPYNTGRLVLVGEDLPKGLLDEFIYEKVVKEKKPTLEEVRSDYSGRFIECCGVFFDSKAYVKFVANDLLLTGLALNKCATGPLNFKFLKYGTGFFAGPFRHLLDRFIGQGVAEGLDNLLRGLPGKHWIKAVELPFFDPCRAINVVCSNYNIDLKYSKDDALKNTLRSCMTATTNSADPHCMTGNKMGFGSVDGAIAENISGKAIKFSPFINKLMKECFF